MYGARALNERSLQGGLLQVVGKNYENPKP